MKHFIKVVAVNEAGGAAKKLNPRLLAKSTLWTQHGNALRSFQCQTGRHDFAPNGRHMSIEQGPLIGVFNFGNDLCHAVRPEEGRTLGALNFTYFFSHLGALVQ